MSHQSEAVAKRAKGPVPHRFEAKYLVPAQLVPDVRAWIAPFCVPDPHGVGDVPEYLVTTMQFDAHGLPLFRAKEDEAHRRFKLRARYYGDSPGDRVFVEVKKKLEGIIVKSRAAVPTARWTPELWQTDRVDLDFRDEREELAFLEFMHLCRDLDAKPTVALRYTRESYFGANERYARVTFDRSLLYRPCRNIHDWGPEGRWFRMDSSLAQGKNVRASLVVLELKCLTDMSVWMRELIEAFGLVRTGNSKYATAMWLEAAFHGLPGSPMWTPEALP